MIDLNDYPFLKTTITDSTGYDVLTQFNANIILIIITIKIYFRILSAKQLPQKTGKYYLSSLKTIKTFDISF